MRRVVQPLALATLKQYLAEEITTEAFRSIFDQKTRTEWLGFGLKGMSGAMFLNKLVKHVPDSSSLTAQVQKVLVLPTDEPAGRRQMEEFAGFLRGVIRAGQAARGQIQPARMPFFVSAWWHLQDTEVWPIYYLSGRHVLEQEGAYRATNDPVQDYFAFRACFQKLAGALGLKSWDFEHVLAWQDRRGKPPPLLPEPPPGETDEGNEPTEKEEFSHAQVQCLLAEIGKKLGCRVWIAANDHSKDWQGKRLGDLSIKSLPPLGLDAGSQEIISRIDVLWLRGSNQVMAAFEVENTTSIYSGLLRLSDLVTQSPNLNFSLYIVVPESRMEKVQRELSRPTFQELELHRRCGFFSNAVLVKDADAILRWANDPSAINRLASKVPDISDPV